MNRYVIAGIRIEINLEGSFYFDKFESFNSNYNTKPHLIINALSVDNMSIPNGDIILNERMSWIRQSTDPTRFCGYIYKYDSEEVSFIFEANKEWDNIVVRYQKDDLIDEAIGLLGESYFRNSILFHQGIMIHASAIKYNGKGIMFSAPSGTGKSTQANLWRTYMGARLLNGDRSAVRVLDGVPTIYGTPWSGSTPEFINDEAPLSAIIMLEQASENSMRKLTLQEAVNYLTPRCFLPYFDENLMKMALRNLGMIISSTPVYLLKCRPDREAVELVYECVK